MSSGKKICALFIILIRASIYFLDANCIIFPVKSKIQITCSFYESRCSEIWISR